MTVTANRIELKGHNHSYMTEDATLGEIELPLWVREVESLAKELAKGTLPVGEQLVGIYRLLGVRQEENQLKGFSQVLRLVQEIRDLMAIVHDLRQDAPTVYTVEKFTRPEGHYLVGVYHSCQDAMRHMDDALKLMHVAHSSWRIGCFSWQGGTRQTVATAQSLS